MQGAVFAIPVSGIAVDGMFDSNRAGPDLLDRGGFDAEALALTTLTCVIVSLLLIRQTLPNHSVELPFWTRTSSALLETEPSSDPLS